MAVNLLKAAVAFLKYLLPYIKTMFLWWLSVTQTMGLILDAQPASIRIFYCDSYMTIMIMSLLLLMFFGDAACGDMCIVYVIIIDHHKLIGLHAAVWERLEANTGNTSACIMYSIMCFFFLRFSLFAKCHPSMTKKKLKSLQGIHKQYQVNLQKAIEVRK